MSVPGSVPLQALLGRGGQQPAGESGFSEQQMVRYVRRHTVPDGGRASSNTLRLGRSLQVSHSCDKLLALTACVDVSRLRVVPSEDGHGWRHGFRTRRAVRSLYVFGTSLPHLRLLRTIIPFAPRPRFLIGAGPALPSC